MDRLDNLLTSIRNNLDDQAELAGVLTNGDVTLPDWAHIVESTDHLKIWDEAVAGPQMGFQTVGYQ